MAKIYGIFEIQTEYFEKIDVIVMENTAKIIEKSSKKLCFDLKGSHTNRKCEFDYDEFKKNDNQ